MTTPTGSKEEMEGRSRSQPLTDAQERSPDAQCFDGKWRTDPITARQEPKYAFVDGRVINRASGEVIPLDEPVMIFRARDRHAEAVIDFYLHLVRDPIHRAAVLARAEHFHAFGRDHPDRMKEPDTEPLPLPPRDEPAASLKSREATLPSREELERALREIGRRARSDGQGTFDDAIRNLGWIDDECRRLSAITSKEPNNG